MMASDDGSDAGDLAQFKRDSILTTYLRDKEKEWASILDQDRPLQLLDLPVDILDTIIREITHTNDLTALALTHSALHALVIPHIYSRFDIVWPDSHSVVDNRVGVDALTYGLATLVMAHDVFGEISSRQTSGSQIHKCNQCGRVSQCSHGPQTSRSRKTRRGNHFAQYTRKFSLGNGPRDWVSEYSCNKEGGKMLGTLVALAVGRMQNLESFVWDMPTGVLRDVWLALASLGDRGDGNECRLERVWVRWHDNSEQRTLHSVSATPSNPTLVSSGPPTSTHTTLNGSPPNFLFQIPPYPRVEFPTFSVLPPLKSLSVLDVDELSYVEELSVLVHTSVLKLRELRLGVAYHALSEPWTRIPEDDPNTSLSHSQRPPSSVPTPGGVLGLLFGRCCDLSNNVNRLAENLANSEQSHIFKKLSLDSKTSVPSAFNAQGELISLGVDQDQSADGNYSPNPVECNFQGGLDYEDNNAFEIDLISSSLAKSHLGNNSPLISSIPNQSSGNLTKGHAIHVAASQQSIQPSNLLPSESTHQNRRSQKLRLTVLELERVPMSYQVLSKAIDWTELTSLTLLGCRNHETLWKALRKNFTPTSRGRSSSLSGVSVSRGIEGLFSQSQNLKRRSEAGLQVEFPLKITRLHTDTVTSSLLHFIRDTLAPDSLEWLFLQYGPSYRSTVTLDMISKTAIRRHRGSLKKLLISGQPPSEAEPSDSHSSRWTFNRDLLATITSGKMHLRELSMGIDYMDWHYFLQRLPNAKELRALHVTRIAQHVHGRVDSREAGLQVLDIVSLRPELELCYLGIQTKCFEILEYPAGKLWHSSTQPSGPALGATGGLGGGGAGEGAAGAGNVTSDAESDDEGGVGGVGGGGFNMSGSNLIANNHANEDDEDEDSEMEIEFEMGVDTSDDEEGHGDAGGKGATTFRLREILFYDDKVSIFKARHGKL